MPVRKIPMNYRSVTGYKSSTREPRLVAVESTLERDFAYVLDFDWEVEHYEEQPIRIDFEDNSGKQRHYTPDFLVRYRGPTPLHHWSYKKTVLYEIKPREVLRKKWTSLKPAFKAAIRHSRKKGWRFKIMTENEIRDSYLENIRFLLHYRKIEHPEEFIWMNKMFKLLRLLRETDPKNLLAAITNDQNLKAELIPVLWKGIAIGEIGTDLHQPLTMKSRIWYMDPRF